MTSFFFIFKTLTNTSYVGVFFPENVKFGNPLFIISLAGALNITTTIPGIVYPVPRFFFEYHRFAGT